MLSEKAGKGQPEKCNGPQSKQASVLTLWALQPIALLRLCAQHCTTSVDQLNTALVAERSSIRYIRMEISTSNQHITFPTNPPTRAPFGHSPQPKTSSPMQPGHQVSLATQILHSPKIPSPDKRKYHASASQSSLDRPATAQPPGIQHSTHSLPLFLANIRSSSSTAPATSL